MSKATKWYLFIGLSFCLVAVLFVLLYHFNVINNLTLMLTSVYVSYFVGIGLMFNGAYCKKNVHDKSAWLNGLLGGAFVIAAIVLLVIGLTNGQIQF